MEQKIEQLPKFVLEEHIDKETRRIAKEYIKFILKLNKKTNKRKGRLQWEVKEGEWEDIKKLRPKVKEYLNYKFDTLYHSRADTHIKSVQLAGYRGVRKKALPWMAVLEMVQETNSADGRVFYSGGDQKNWQSSFAKTRPYSPQLRIRKKR